MSIDVCAKISQREINKEERKTKRAEWWRQRRCFWTYPFGHVYGACNRCVGCSVKWSNL